MQAIFDLRKRFHSLETTMGKLFPYTILLAGLAGLAAAIPSVSYAADPERGRSLYENHCTQCHESLVHVRQHRRATSLDAVRYQINRWRGVLGLDWSSAESEDVLHYLNDQYYRYPMP
jgi:hypothetical protein